MFVVYFLADRLERAGLGDEKGARAEPLIKPSIKSISLGLRAAASSGVGLSKTTHGIPAARCSLPRTECHLLALIELAVLI